MQSKKINAKWKQSIKSIEKDKQVRRSWLWAWALGTLPIFSSKQYCISWPQIWILQFYLDNYQSKYV